MTSYYAYFYSILKYCVILWGNSPTSIRVFRIQKQAVRILSGTDTSRVKSSCRSKFKQLNLLTLPSLFIYQSIIFLLNNKKYTQSRSQIHAHNTRNKNCLQLSYTNTSVMEKGCLVSSIKLYNKLPPHLKDLTQEQTKSQLKSYLIDKEFYSVRDFMAE